MYIHTNTRIHHILVHIPIPIPISQRWSIPIKIFRGQGRNSAEVDQRMGMVQQGVKDAVINIVSIVNDKKDHIPALSNLSEPANSVCFPLEISSSVGHRQESSWGDAVKDIIRNGPPKLI